MAWLIQKSRIWNDGTAPGAPTNVFNSTCSCCSARLPFFVSTLPFSVAMRYGTSGICLAAWLNSHVKRTLPRFVSLFLLIILKFALLFFRNRNLHFSLWTLCFRGGGVHLKDNKTVFFSPLFQLYFFFTRACFLNG